MYWLTKIAQHKILVVLIAAFVFGMMLSPVVFAQEGGEPDVPPLSFGMTYGEQTGLGSEDVRGTVAGIINVALGLLGVVAVVIILWGGFRWMTAGGNDEKVGEARKIIFSGIIGLAIVLSAWAIAKFVLEQLYTATTGLEDVENL